MGLETEVGYVGVALGEGQIYHEIGEVECNRVLRPPYLTMDLIF